MDIAIQPASKAQAGTILYPPIVISVPYRALVHSGTAVPEIFQGFLQDASGNVIEGAGPYIASPQPLSASSPSSHKSRSSTDYHYVVFPDVEVDIPGKYTFTVRYYDPTDVHSWCVLGELHTRSITVTDNAVSAKELGSDERKLLKKLKASGNFGV